VQYQLLISTSSVFLDISNWIQRPSSRSANYTELDAALFLLHYLRNTSIVKTPSSRRNHPAPIMISYPHRSSSGTNLHKHPSQTRSDRPSIHKSHSIGPWPLKSRSFRTAFQCNQHRNRVGPWPLRRPRTDSKQQLAEHEPLLILHDLREANTRGVYQTWREADENCTPPHCKRAEDDLCWRKHITSVRDYQFSSRTQS
jgi:hypothetical protein